MSRFASVNLLLLNLRACWADSDVLHNKWEDLRLMRTSLSRNVHRGGERWRLPYSQARVRKPLYECMSTWSFVKFVNVSLVFARVGIWQILRLQNSSHLNDYLRVLGIANRILLVVHFYIASIYIRSLIILPLMTSSLYLIFIANHGKLLMCGILSSSLFRCHVELWCTNRSLFRVIYFFCSNPILCQCFCWWKG